MANIRSGSIVSEIRGKVSTEIYSRNGGGAYVKGYTSPVQPNTQSQLNTRDYIRSAVEDWQQLTDQERLQWNEFAKTQTYRNKLGEVKTPTGYNLYVGRKALMLSIGAGQAINPRNGTFKIDEFPSINTLDSSSFIINRGIRSGDGLIRLKIACSDSVSTARTSPNGISFATLSTPSMSDLPSTIDITSVFENHYGVLSGKVGDKIFVRFRFVGERMLSSLPTAKEYVGRQLGGDHIISGIVGA